MNLDADLDRDDLSVVRLLRLALEQSGLSQAAFGRALGTSASRMSTYLTGRTRPSAYFLVRAQRVGDALAAARDKELASAPVIAIGMRRHLLAGDPDGVRTALVQGCCSLATILAGDDPDLLGAWEAEPTSTGAVTWDALLAAVAAREYAAAGRSAPGWAHREPLAEPWSPIGASLLWGGGPTTAQLVDETPDWLRRHNIFAPSSFLEED